MFLINFVRSGILWNHHNNAVFAGKIKSVGYFEEWIIIQEPTNV
jgi:hypothetical protein